MVHALVCTLAHRDPHLFYEQTLAYNRMLDDDCIHIVNINLARSKAFFHRAEALGISFDDFDNLIFVDRFRTLRPPLALGILALNFEYALRRGIRADYVILHTSSDLPYRTGLKAHMAQYDIGQASPELQGEDYTWFQPVRNDPAMSAFRETLSLQIDTDPSKVFARRFEGSFFRWPLMQEIFFALAFHFGFDSIYHWSREYPMEEHALPMMAQFLVERDRLRQTRHFVFTVLNDPRFPGIVKREPPKPEHLPTLLTFEPEIFSFKFAPTDPQSPVRDWAFEQLGLPLERRIRR